MEEVVTSVEDNSVADTAVDSADNTAEASVDRATDRHRAATEDTHPNRDMEDTKEVQVAHRLMEPVAMEVPNSSTVVAAVEDEEVLPVEEEAEVVGAPDKAFHLIRTIYCHSCDFSTRQQSVGTSASYNYL